MRLSIFLIGLLVLWGCKQSGEPRLRLSDATGHTCAECGRLEFRLAQTTDPLPDFSAPPKHFNIAPSPILTGAHVETLSLVEAEGGGPKEIRIILSRDAAKMFEEITRRNVGKYIALLFNGHEVAQPGLIREAIPGGSLNYQPGEEDPMAMERLFDELKKTLKLKPE
jgi:preprotein translocase subunit SecD